MMNLIFKTSVLGYAGGGTWATVASGGTILNVIGPGVGDEALLFLSTPMFLPGESQGRWSLVGCRLWGHTE